VKAAMKIHHVTTIGSQDSVAKVGVQKEAATFGVQMEILANKQEILETIS